jgi:hypothetical protein
MQQFSSGKNQYREFKTFDTRGDFRTVEQPRETRQLVQSTSMVETRPSAGSGFYVL